MNKNKQAYKRPSKEAQLEMQRKALNSDKRIAEEGWTMIVNQYDKLITFVIKKILMNSQHSTDFETLEYIRSSVYFDLCDKSLAAWNPDKNLNGNKTRQLGSWIGLIATHKTIDFLRGTDIFIKEPDKKIPTEITVSTEDSEDEVSILDLFGIAYDVDVADKLHARNQLLRLTLQIRNVPSEVQRKILHYTLNEHMEIDEIARIMNIDKAKAIQLKMAALKKLKKLYNVSSLGISWTDESDFNKKLHALQQKIRKLPDETDREILKQTFQSKQPNTIAKSLNMDYHELIYRQGEAMEKLKFFLKDPDNRI
jgi:DNA-directed RNA polymerase specialized sigma24 family protein